MARGGGDRGDRGNVREKELEDGRAECICMYIHSIYICREREREREKES